MATVVETIPSARDRTKWAKYCDGRVYRFVEGVDFIQIPGKPLNMLAGFWWACRVNGLRAVRRSRIEDGVRVIYVQAVKPDNK